MPNLEEANSGKKERKKRTAKLASYFTINVKLYSSTRKSANGYRNLIRELREKKIFVRVRGDRAIAIKNVFEKPQSDILYGKICSFTDISEATRWFNTDQMEVTEFSIPSNIRPNARESEYIFYPQFHRFILFSNSSGVSVENCKTFLEFGLKKLVTEDEDIVVIVEKTRDILSDLDNARSIKSIDLEISYTNQDNLSNAAAELLDRRMKETNVAKLFIRAKADQSQNIDLQHNELLGSAISMARTDGDFKASVRDQNNKLKIINSKDYYAKEKIAVKENDQAEVITDLNKVLQFKTQNDVDS